MRTLLVAAFVVAGCNSSPSSAPSPSGSAATSNAPAGKVVEVTGTVTVAGKPLAVGDSVTASDVIDTGADGSVSIELTHNHVRLSLAANQHVRVNESLAWKQPRKVDADEQTVATTSAGRPAERNAADTPTSTGATDNTKADDAKAQVAINEKTEDKADKKAESPKAVRNLPPKTETAKATSSSGPGDGLAGLGVTGTGLGGGGTGQGKGLGGLGGGDGQLAVQNKVSPEISIGTPNVSGALDVAVVRRVVKQHIGQIRYCYESGLKRDPSLAGSVVVRFTFDKTGKVVDVTRAEGTTLTDSAVVQCITERIRTWQFPKAPGADPITVTYPFVLKT